jgi:hypothetical protein
VVGDTNGANDLISQALNEGLAGEGRLAALYDRSIYQAAAGDEGGAVATIDSVCEDDWRFGGMAAVDRALEEFPAVRDAAIDRAALAERAGDERREAVLEQLGELTRRLPAALPLLASDDPWAIARADSHVALAAADDAIASAANRDTALAERGEHLDAADRHLDEATRLIDQLTTGLAEALERSRRPVEQLPGMLPDDLVFLSRDDPWRRARADALATTQRIQAVVAQIDGLDDHASQERVALADEVERLAGIADDLLGRLTAELPEASRRNDEARNQFDRALSSPAPQPPSRGFLGRRRGR